MDFQTCISFDLKKQQHIFDTPPKHMLVTQQSQRHLNIYSLILLKFSNVYKTFTTNQGTKLMIKVCKEELQNTNTRWYSSSEFKYIIIMNQSTKIIKIKMFLTKILQENIMMQINFESFIKMYNDSRHFFPYILKWISIS